MLDFSYRQVESNGGVTTLVLSDFPKYSEWDYLLTCAESLIEDGQTKLVLDCSELETISSFGIYMLMRLQSNVHKAGGDLRVAGVRGTVAEILRLFQLDHQLKMYDTVDRAVEAFGA